MESVCYRCGTCCRGFFAVVPKTEDVDLSPEFLERLSQEKSMKEIAEYISENSQPMGATCVWLGYNEDGAAFCKVYEHRSADCRNYPGGDCKIGKHLKGEAMCSVPSSIGEVVPTRDLG